MKNGSNTARLVVSLPVMASSSEPATPAMSICQNNRAPIPTRPSTSIPKEANHPFRMVTPRRIKMVSMQKRMIRRINLRNTPPNVSSDKFNDPSMDAKKYWTPNPQAEYFYVCTQNSQCGFGEGARRAGGVTSRDSLTPYGGCLHCGSSSLLHLYSTRQWH